jgi:chemotaxis signal transduction protein
MDNADLVHQLSGCGEDEDASGARAREPEHKFVVFLVGEKRYAFRAEKVREIVINTDVYFIPFVPPYITGLINRHGEPHSVFDLRILLDNEPMKASKLLIMNHAQDHVAFLISDVVRVVSIPERGIHPMPSSEEQQVFEGYIAYEGAEIFIINVQDIYDRLQNDLQNI